MEKLTKEERRQINEHLQRIMSVSNVFKDALGTMRSFESRPEENLFFRCFQAEMLNHIIEIDKIIYNITNKN